MGLGSEETFVLKFERRISDRQERPEHNRYCSPEKSPSYFFNDIHFYAIYFLQSCLLFFFMTKSMNFIRETLIKLAIL